MTLKYPIFYIPFDKNDILFFHCVKELHVAENINKIIYRNDLETNDENLFKEKLIEFYQNINNNKSIKKIKPKYIILKPTLLGGFSACDKWINIANKSNIGWWLTSALESNVGLNAISQYASYLNVKNHQGLGTGSLYQNNFPSPLMVENGYLFFSDIKKWNFEENDL